MRPVLTSTGIWRPAEKHAFAWPLLLGLI
jgi:hypothetical protein